MTTYVVRITCSVVVESDSLEEAKKDAEQFLKDQDEIIDTVIVAAVKSNYMED